MEPNEFRIRVKEGVVYIERPDGQPFLSIVLEKHNANCSVSTIYKHKLDNSTDKVKQYLNYNIDITDDPKVLDGYLNPCPSEKSMLYRKKRNVDMDSFQLKP